MRVLKTLKKLFAKEYEIKDLGEVKTIIGWLVIRDTAVRTMKIDQSAFIIDLIIEEELIECNTNVIPIKAGSAIEMIKLNNDEETNL